MQFPAWVYCISQCKENCIFHSLLHTSDHHNNTLWPECTVSMQPKTSDKWCQNHFKAVFLQVRCSNTGYQLYMIFVMVRPSSNIQFSTKNDALQIVIYYDEVETANPLGSYHGKHKLGMQFVHEFVRYVRFILLSHCLYRYVLLPVGKYCAQLAINSKGYKYPLGVEGHSLKTYSKKMYNNLTSNMDNPLWDIPT